MTFETELCKCNMCDTIMVDENPQVGAELYEIKDGYVYFNKENQMIEEMSLENDMGDSFWACPICLTDDYLTDL